MGWGGEDSGQQPSTAAIHGSPSLRLTANNRHAASRRRVRFFFPVGPYNAVFRSGWPADGDGKCASQARCVLFPVVLVPYPIHRLFGGRSRFKPTWQLCAKKDLFISLPSKQPSSSLSLPHTTPPTTLATLTTLFNRQSCPFAPTCYHTQQHAAAPPRPRTDFQQRDKLC